MKYFVKCTHESKLFFSFLSEEPEEEISFEDLEDRARAGDAKAQTKVSVRTYSKYCWLY